MKRSDFYDLAERGVVTFGDLGFRGDCQTESMEQMIAVSDIRMKYPQSAGRVIVHIENEGQLRGGQFHGMRKRKAMGLTTGAVDLIIPGTPTFVCEMKRRDYTKSKWQEGQQEYLIAASEMGAFSCVALGAGAVLDAVEAWMNYL